MRQYTLLEQIFIAADRCLKNISGQTDAATRANPAAACSESDLSAAQKQHAAGLMRVNHAGEICAQALYQGQALTARDEKIKTELQQAAKEEADHLAWCQQRLQELNSHTSYLNPLWYIGSLALGATAGLLGDKISLGFLAETERQVEQHLTEHLQKLPIADAKSKCILEQMRQDEAQHATTAIQAGAAELPLPVKIAMRYMSKVMTVTAYWL